MPDFKLWEPEHCARYLRASDYADVPRASIAAMHDQVGVLRFDENGLAMRGVLVRHLVMPGLLQDTRSILRWLAIGLSPDTYLNLMAQYHPAHLVVTRPQFSEINRCLNPAEFRQALAAADAVGLWRLDTRRA